MNLPSPQLKPLSPVTLSRLQDSISVLARIGQGAGKPHKSEIEELERRLARYHSSEITFDHVVTNTRLARAFLYAYPGDLMAGRAVNFDDNVLNVLWSHISRRPSALLATYFYCHSHMPAWQSVANKLRIHYDGISLDDCPSLEIKTKNFAETLFAENAPQRIAKYAAERGISAAQMELEAGIPPEGKFHDDVVLWYYVCHVRSLPMGEVSSCLKEATEKNVSELPFKGRMLGHAVIEAMCMRCNEEQQLLPQPWLKRIMNVAGDPRVGKATAAYQRWWSTQRPEVISIVKAALANRDLKYFLDALAEFASTQDGDIARMFHSRRMFLQGILKTGLVKDALLILSESAADYINRRLPADERKHFHHSYLSDSRIDQSCVYLEVPSGHIIEGTHQSCFRIYAADSRFAKKVRDIRPPYISYRDVTGSDYVEEIAHQRQVNWQAKVMVSLNYYLGVQVDPQDALDSQDYRAYIAQYDHPY